MPITITVLDTGGIQSFIFGSNVLRENVGASELVHWATRLWAFEALDSLNIPHNVNLEAAKIDEIGSLYSDSFVVNGSDAEGAEVLYAGGGNTVILFQGKEPLAKAQEFVYQLSRRLLVEAPGLNLYAAHQPYEWGKKPSIPETIQNALKELGRQKGKAIESRPALGWPVTAACTSTGLPANHHHPDEKGKTGSASRANRQVAAKWWAALAPEENRATDRLDARTRLRALLPEVGKGKEFDWSDDLDLLGDLPERDDSYIAVVHADGNGMGQRIKELGDLWKEQRENPRGYINAMRGLSTSVQATAQKALKETLRTVLGHLTDHSGPGPRRHATKRDYRIENGERKLIKVQKIFPVRPVVFGGDDVTLVCAGPWGLAVATRYLAELEKLEMDDGQGGKTRPYACAGVAIVKTHYPFFQAYKLSEDLIKKAKGLSKELAGKKASTIDWHLTTTGLHGDLDTIRAREYSTPTGPLTMRPLMLRADKTWRNWDNLIGLLDFFGNDGDWQERRNKIMRLREALRRGPDGVAEFWAIFGEKGKSLPDIMLPDGLILNNGWVRVTNSAGELRCAYFDSIEIADHFFTLPDPDPAPAPAKQEA